MDDERLTRVHHIECCTVDQGPEYANLCPRCLDTLILGSEAEKRLTEELAATPCSVCGKTGYYQYTGPTYNA